MTQPINRIVNVETNEVTDIPFTKKELDAYAAEEKASQKAAADKAASKAALLDRLGITAEEAVLLLA